MQIYIFKAGKDKEGYYRIFCDHKENNRPYAQSRIYDNGMEEICYLKEFQNSFSESQNTFSHIGFEELLIRKNAIVLHASLIESEYGGILFTGPSGIGKSTQADMWAKYEKVEILNGDRPILKKENENWKRGLQEMSPLQIAQSAFEKIYQVEMPVELTGLFEEAYLAATRKEEEEEE